ncbi:MAG: TRAP transporter substrate-binding protein DctP [Alphaproteobacteria bacterium]|nr:TRAP transporter substrate-binding protein DctP [Alphaproteobacteria bacterium]
MNKMIQKLVGVAIATTALVATPALSETLRLVTNWDTGSYSVARTLEFVKTFNESEAAKAADINIIHVGGPEVTPATEQLTGLSNGVFDMLFGAAGYYVGAVPEAYAIYGTSLTPMEARQSGATELFDKIYREKANAHVLGWVAAGVGYHIWLKDEPKLNDQGLPMLDGLKIRSSGFYNAWLGHYGATTVSVPAPDIYNALERGVVDGAAWPGLGITDLGWEKFVGYRIDPPVWQFDNMLWINQDKWNSLTDAQRKALSDAVEAYEPVAHEFYRNLVGEERAEVEAAGVKSFTLGAEAETAYLDHAQKLQWQQVKEKAPENHDALQSALAARN